MTMKEFWNRPIKFGLFTKIMVLLNVLFAMLFIKVANSTDYKDEQTIKYQQYLENRIDTQSKLINVQQQIINMYKNN